jgi:hypothetical protein
MLIKYKGTTSAILKDLSLELKSHVDLKLSEDILKAFLGTVLKEISTEKSIELISNLPPSLKPFCNLSRQNPYPSWELFYSSQESQTIASIMKVLEKYISPDKLANVYSCFPETLFSNSYPIKKQVLIRA